jgi:hypothetical protein
MILSDMNQSWRPPENYRFVNTTAEGSFLVHLYSERLFRPGTTEVIGTNYVTIYVNDMGREVSRTQYRVDVVPPRVRMGSPNVSRSFRFRNGFLIALQGLQEMAKCLKK